MQKFFERVKTSELRLGLLGLGTITVVVMIVALIIPNGKALFAANAAVETLRIASQDGLELERHLQEAKEKNDRLRFRLYGDMANIPANQVEAHIIGRLQEISWAANIELISIEPGLGEQVQIFQETIFKVEVVGQYDDLYRWLWNVRQELGYVVVKEYALTRSGDSDAAPSLHANLSLASYRAIE